MAVALPGIRRSGVIVVMPDGRLDRTACTSRTDGSGDAAGDDGIAEAVAGGQGVGSVQGWPIILTHRSGDAALGPGGGRALGQWYLGQQDDGPRRKPERGHQPGKTAADDDGATGEVGTHGLHGGLP